VARGPKGRYETATTVRSWSVRYSYLSEARRADTSQLPRQLIVPRLRRSIRLMILGPRADGRGYFMTAPRASSYRVKTLFSFRVVTFARAHA
jgi:hypothetical protein